MVGCAVARWDVSDRKLLQVAADQHGVFSADQAESFGVGRSTVHGRVRRGQYRRLHDNVYAIGGAPMSWRQEVVGLVLSVPNLAAASHRTAAHIWDLTSLEPVRTEVVTVRHKRVRRRHPQVHESKDLEPRDVVTVDGIPTTTPVRTIVDLGASASPAFVERCLDTGLRTGQFLLDDVARYIRRVARSGRNGIGTIRPLVQERSGWSSLSESALEDLFIRLVSHSGLPTPVQQHRVMDGDRVVARADFAYPDRQILIELDGEQFHMDRETFQRDREKQNLAHALGWTVYRFTWRQLQDNPSSVLAVLTRALAPPPL